MLSIYEMHDSALDYFEELTIKDAMMEFKEKHPECPIHLYGARTWSEGNFSSADWYVKIARRIFMSGHKSVQLDAEDILKLLDNNPWQKDDPHITVFFTSRELARRDSGICDGMTRGLNTVQSVFRYRELNSDNRKTSIQSVISAELGRILKFSD